jgi:hypothetical protein
LTGTIGTCILLDGMSGSFRQRLSALVMLPLLLFAGLARGELFRCQYDNVVRESCCCPESSAPETTTPILKAVARGCCDVSTMTPDSSPKDAPRQLSVVPPIAGPAISQQQLVVADLRPAAMMARWTARDTSAPIIRLTCSLLI